MSEGRLDRAQVRRLALSAYLPTGVSMIGHGAIAPLLPLTARDLGASVPEAALIVALISVGMLLGTVPAGVLADRFGERRAIVAACGVDAVALLAAMLAPSLWVLGLVALILGLSLAVFGLARQAYLTVAIPPAYRARSLSTLGGVYRAGAFIGPLLGAAIVTVGGLRAAYLMAVATSLIAAVATLALPDVTPAAPAVDGSVSTSTWTLLRTHLTVFLTIGLGAASLNLVRAGRDSILPLWSDAAGLSAAQISLIFGLGAGVDMLLFYAGGSVMDRLGRRAVAIPAMVIMGAAFALLPLAHSFTTILSISLLLGFGNGISAGVVMTLGSDRAPAEGMSRFLALWRLTSGLGSAAGPLTVTAVAAAATLGAAAWAVAGVAVLGSLWIGRFGSRGGPDSGRA